MQQRTAVISAAASGIGRVLAEGLLADGWRLFICDADPVALADFATAHPDTLASRVDVADHHRSTGRGQCSGDGPPDARTRAGDHRDRSLNLHDVFLPHHHSAIPPIHEGFDRGAAQQSGSDHPADRQPSGRSLTRAPQRYGRPAFHCWEL